MRAYLGIGLRTVGYDVREAGSGEEALLIVGSSGGTIHTVVSDVVMPGLGGVGLAKALGASHPGIHILFMSGYDESRGGGIGALCGRFDLITKPFSVSDLVSKIREGEQRKVWSAAHGVGARNAQQ